MKKLFSTILFAACFLFMSCKKESIDATTYDKGESYVPIEIGKYITYEYDSTIYDNKGIDKYIFKGFIKEEIAEKISETNGEIKYKLIKYWKKNLADQWLLTDVETITKSPTNLVKTEENLPFIKMVFPNNNGTSWKGNGLFDENIIVKVYGEGLAIYQDWTYKIENKGSSRTYKDKEYKDVLDVVQKDDGRDPGHSIYARRYSKEIFAKGIGLIRKEMEIFETQKPIANKPWDAYAEKGYSLTQTIIDHN